MRITPLSVSYNNKKQNSSQKPMGFNVQQSNFKGSMANSVNRRDLEVIKNLREFYRRQPDAIFKETELTEQYFKKNPLQKEMQSRLLYHTWQAPAIKQTRMLLESHLGIKINKKDLLIISLNSKKYRDSLECFWEKYPYEKERFRTVYTNVMELEEDRVKYGRLK